MLYPRGKLRQLSDYRPRFSNKEIEFISFASSSTPAVRSDPEWRRQFVRLAMRRERAIAKVAMARKLAVSLLWMRRDGVEYAQRKKFGSLVG